jgi:2Fe-2S ferredoxin
MLKIIFKTKTGEKIVNAISGDTILDVAKKNDIVLFGGCSGAGVCGSCRILISKDAALRLPDPSDLESDVLEISPSIDDDLCFRLACQVVVTDDCDGMIVTVP